MSLKCAATALFFAWLATCQCEDIRAIYGTFRSDSYPGTYPNNLNQTWNITVANGYVVRLYFTVFDVEDSYDAEANRSCIYDYIEINGRRCCGKMGEMSSAAPRHGQVFRSESNEMLIQFVSDYSNEDPKPHGFVAHYHQEDLNECKEFQRMANEVDWDRVVMCNQYCNNVPGSYYCSCRPDFTLHSNLHTCVARCPESVIIAAGNGTLSSSDYPQPYSKLANCQRTIQAAPGYVLDIKFDILFDIEDHYEEGCSYDWVKVLLPDGASTKYCGSSAPGNGSWLQLNSPSVIVEFHSDLSLEKSGYKLYYDITRKRCPGIEDVANGAIQLPDINRSFLQYEDEVEFICDRGYRLVGSDTLTCGVDGSWDNDQPTCEIKVCPRPEQLLNIPNSLVQNSENLNLTYGSTLEIECIEWYELNSGSTSWRCEDDQTWQPVNRISIVYNDNLPLCVIDCGKKNTVAESIARAQIIGGRKARVGEWPWMAFLDLASRGVQSSTFCGGSLVETQYVVTAAHCVPDGLRNFLVFLGVTDRLGSPNPHMQVFRAIEVTSHPLFVNPDLNNLMDDDIAVIKLNASAVIGQYVRPICIPRTPRQQLLPEYGAQQREGYQKRGIITGWGKTENNLPSTWLMMTRVPFVNRTICLASFAKQTKNDPNYSRIKITLNMICAGFVDRGRDSCKGDSGGPLMFRDLNTNKWYMNGIVSFGTSAGCTRLDTLGVYTKVANYIGFLDTHIV